MIRHLRCSAAALVVATTFSAWAQEPSSISITPASDPVTVVVTELGRVLGMSVPMVAGLIYLARVFVREIGAWRPTIRVEHAVAEDEAEQIRSLTERVFALERHPKEPS